MRSWSGEEYGEEYGTGLTGVGHDWSANEDWSAASSSEWWEPPPSAGKGSGKGYGKGKGKGKGKTGPSPSAEYSTGGKGKSWSGPRAPVGPPPGMTKGKGKPWTTDVTSEWASEQQPGWATGYDWGHNYGWNEGHSKGYGKGYQDGFRAGLAAGHQQAETIAQAHAVAGEYSSAEAPTKTSKKTKGAYSRWLDQYFAKDPANMKLFPRFQVWQGHDWMDFVESINKSLRSQCVVEGTNELIAWGEVEVDLGKFEGEEFKYNVHVAPDVVKEHDDVCRAIQAVKHHTAWEEAFVPEVVGWQVRVDDDSKIRPVRIVLGEASGVETGETRDDDAADAEADTRIH